MDNFNFIDSQHALKVKAWHSFLKLCRRGSILFTLTLIVISCYYAMSHLWLSVTLFQLRKKIPHALIQEQEKLTTSLNQINERINALESLRAHTTPCTAVLRSLARHTLEMRIFLKHVTVCQDTLIIDAECHELAAINQLARALKKESFIQEAAIASLSHEKHQSLDHYIFTIKGTLKRIESMQ